MINKPTFWILSCAVAFGGITAARAETPSPVVLANTCFSCHGTDGDSVGAMPSIKGKPAAYISTMLTAFRNGSRKGTVMNRIAKGFSPDEIAALSRYFANKQ
jgi:sulfide dehydrogenase cytochrome subunit